MNKDIKIATPPNRETDFLWKVCGEFLKLSKMLNLKNLFKPHKIKQMKTVIKNISILFKYHRYFIKQNPTVH